MLLISLDNLLEHRDIVVSPAALMEAQGPERRYCCSALVLMESLDCGFCACIAQEKPEIENPTNDFISKSVLGSGVVFYNNVHGIGTPEIIDMEISLLLANQIQREIPISLMPIFLIQYATPIPIKHSQLALPELKALTEPLAKPINQPRIHHRRNLQIMLTKDEVPFGRVKQH